MDEKILLKAVRNLDQGALAQVFEQYAPALFKYALRLSHNPQEADDVVGEVFSRLLDRLTEGKGPRENLRSYLYQTAYHILVDHTREQKHYSPLKGVETQPKDGYLLPPEEAEEHRKMTLLQSAINSVLTDDQKHVIVLRFLEGFNLRETAGILNKDIGNIKVIQNRAVAKLCEALSKEFEDL